MTPKYSTVIVRYGEIGIKSDQTRKRMTRLLVQHLHAALSEYDVEFKKIRNEFGRIFIDSDSALRAAEVASRVFGVVSTSAAVESSSSLDSILNVGYQLAKSEFEREKSFAVRARRIGKHDYSSQDVRERLGERILKDLSDYNLTVNLTSPDQSVHVEVRDEKAYIFMQIIEGVKGMPTGSQGKVVCTISGGLDSPVAAYKVMRRGCIPVFVTFDNTPFAEESPRRVAIKQAEVLASYIYNNKVKMYIIPHGNDLEEAQKHGPPKMICLFCKRNMLRMAREVALLEDADGIVTGEIIGEQASQTSRNLRAIESAVCDFPILRPCLGDDKVDIEHLAAKIGTYQFASEQVVSCTLPPRYPIIHADLDKVKEAEQKMNFDTIRKQVLAAEVLVLRERNPRQ